MIDSDNFHQMENKLTSFTTVAVARVSLSINWHEKGDQEPNGHSGWTAEIRLISSPSNTDSEQ